MRLHLVSTCGDMSDICVCGYTLVSLRLTVRVLDPYLLKFLCLYVEAQVGNCPSRCGFWKIKLTCWNVTCLIMMHSYPGLWEIFSVVVWLMVSMSHGKHSQTKQVSSFGCSSWCLSKSVKLEFGASCILLAEETLPFSTYPSAVEPQTCSAYPDSSGLNAWGRRCVSLVTDFCPVYDLGPSVDGILRI